MKKYVIFLMCLILSILVFGQEEIKELKVNLEEVEVTPPKFTGIKNVVTSLSDTGSDQISDYLAQKVIYPKRASDLGKEGTEVVQFTVTSSGELKDFKVINSVCEDIDFELISALESTSGMWKPGSNNGKSTSMVKEVSMVFNLGEYKNRTASEKFNSIAINYFNKGNKNLFYKNNAKKALKQFNAALVYLPYESSLLFARGMAKYALEDSEGAQQDWDRMKYLAENGKSEKSIVLITDNYKELKGFKELQSYLNE